MTLLLWLLAGGISALAAEPFRAPSAESAAQAIPRDVEIDRIDVTGVTLFTQQEIEEALEVSPGDRLERVKALRTVENLQALYRVHGYEKVRISSRLARRKGEGGEAEWVLEFAVQEGYPTRVVSSRVVPVASGDESFQRYWRALEPQLLQRVGLSPGDVYDQEKIADGKRAVLDLLASEEFVGAKVDEVRVLDAPPPPGSRAEAARWVELEFRVDLGDRVTFGFRGSTVFTHGHLSALVEDQRVLGFGKDYVLAIRDRIVDEYKAEGYALVRVTPYTFERPGKQERHVTYEIQEGPRVHVSGIDFDGNAVFGADELREQFMAHVSPIVQHGYYVEKDVLRAAELTVEWMKSKGYLAAKLVTVNAIYPDRSRRAGMPIDTVHLIIYLYEGDQTTVQAVRLSGVEAFTRDEVESLLSVQEGEPLNLFAFSEGVESLKAAYRDKGYLGARILNEGTDRVIRYSQENRLADVSLEVSEGPQYKVSRIFIDGLTYTKDVVVRRELAFKEGEILRESQLTESENRLRRLGIFSVVAIRVSDDPSREDGKYVRISIQEASRGVLEWGPGFRQDLGARAFGQFAWTNLLGENHTIAFNLNANHRFEDFHFVEYQGQVLYVWPWFAGLDITFRPTLTVSGTQYAGFDATSISAAATWEKRLLQKPALTALFTYNLERVNQFNAISASPIDNQELRIGSIIPALRIDTRDDPLSPTTGWFATASYELASPSFFSQGNPPVSYTRFQARVDRHIPITRDVSWYLSFRTGFERDLDPSNPIPLIKEFALGGAGSLRGYNEQELNVQGAFGAPNVAIAGTLSYVNYRTQLDLPFAGALRFGPFLDAANLLVDQYSLGNLKAGAGVGFHYQTPVGPVNLDWGFKLNPEPNTDTYRFYFSIGVI